MSTVFTRLKNSFQQQGIMVQIIIVNIAVFLTVNVVGNLSHLDLAPYLSIPLNGEEFIYKFWTLFTYMFTHEGLAHIFWNLVSFYFYAQIFYLLLGQKKLLYVYVMSGICGGALVLLLGILLPASFANSILLGASAAVLGVGGVMLVYAPNYRVFLFGLIELPFKYIYLIFFALSTIIDLSINTGGKISHIGGALFGILYGYQLKRGVDMFDFAFLKRNKSKLKIVSHNPPKAKEAKISNEEATMNALLDKISKSGYDSLTKAEKDLLFKLSQKK
jgi:membrane associated rhomboid family serine protease